MEKIAWCAAVVLLGCGGSSYEYASSSPSPVTDAATSTGGYAEAGYAGDAPMAPPAEPASISMDEADYGGGAGDFDSWESMPAREEPVSRSATTSPTQPQLAQNAGGQAAQGQPGTAQPQTQRPAEQTDAVDTSGPLLIYTAQLHLGVYEVEATQEAVIGIINEVDGFIAQRTDTMIVVRVPAARFQQVLDRIEGAGDVLHRQIEAVDVGEEFRDLEIRIRNAEAMRDRLEQLLRQANNVEEALAVERELQRLTESIEQMKGRIRWLADRISFSTITIHFQARTTETLNTDPFRLPFQWLDTLGLSNLLSL